MKVVILAGGYGTRISEESATKPKPMIEVQGKPLLWYVMRNYYRFGFKEFIICTGYKGSMINAYFKDYYLNNSDIQFDYSQEGKYTVLHSYCEDWKVTVVNTGLDTLTGGRIKRIEPYIGKEPFMMTYGDGVADVNIQELVEKHKSSNNLVTLTAVRPIGRFGVLELNEAGQVKRFAEKRREDMDWINGGYMVLEPEIFQYIEGEQTIFEEEPLEKVAKEGRLGTYIHNGFWQCVDTMKDRRMLEEYVQRGEIEWIK